MVDIPIKKLRQLHYDSDQLRGLFYDMDASEGGVTRFILKNAPLVAEDYEKAADLALQINQSIIDIDAENTTNKIDNINYQKVIEDLIVYLNDLEIKYRERMEIASRNDNFNLYSKYHDIYDEVNSIDAYVDNLIFEMKYKKNE